MEIDEIDKTLDLMLVVVTALACPLVLPAIFPLLESENEETPSN